MQIFRAAVAHEPLREKFRRKLKIDKARTGDGNFDERGIDFAGSFQRFNERGRQRTRIRLGAFRFAEDAVCLIIAEARIGRAHFGRKFRRKTVGRSATRRKIVSSSFAGLNQISIIASVNAFPRFPAN